MSRKHCKAAVMLAAVLLMSSCSEQGVTVIDHDPDKIKVLQPEGDIRREDEPVVEAVRLPEVTSAQPAAIPESAATTTVIAPSEPPDIASELSLRLDGVDESGFPMLDLSGTVTKKYTYEYQVTNGDISILGPNLVYVGEGFDFDFIYPGEHENARVRWSLSGNCGTIDQKGVFTSKAKGTCTVTATDITHGTSAALRLHCITCDDDVDFIPLVNNIPIANKSFPLPKDYDPGLDPNARAAFLQMQADAKAQGLNIFPISAYRSYTYQQQVYAGWVRMYGSDADLISARPGHSEHQLGLAIDVNSAEYAFANTAEGKWLKAHCSDYGFILRYPSHAAREYTGYAYEPWHIRYVGRSVAKSVEASGKTLEECLNIDSYYR